MADLDRRQPGGGRWPVDPAMLIGGCTAFGNSAGTTQMSGGGDGKAMLGFTRMYEAHAAREDTIVFPAFKQALGQQRYDELGDQFEEIERQQFGGDGFDMAVDKVANVERALGLTDLAIFTAPPLAKS